MNGNFFRIGMMVLALLAAMSMPAYAKTYSYSTGSTTTGGVFGVSVDAKATFDVSAGSMVVTLTNLQSNITNVGQDISSLWFTVNNGSSILSLSGASVTLSGNLIDIGSNGVMSTAGTLTDVKLGTKGTSTEHWSAGQGTSQFYFNDLNGGGQPYQTIIGPPGSNGKYGSVNNSIYGNTSHNPFIQNQATFRIQAAGLLATSTISDIKVGFGTNDCNTPTVRMVPEPGSLALLAIGALAFAGVLRRKTIEETHA